MTEQQEQQEEEESCILGVRMLKNSTHCVELIPIDENVIILSHLFVKLTDKIYALN